MAAGVNFMETPLVLWVSVFYNSIITPHDNFIFESKSQRTFSTLQVETFRNGRALEFKDLCDGVFLNDVMLQM